MIGSSTTLQQARTNRASRLITFGSVIVIAMAATIGWYGALIYIVIKAGFLIQQIASN